MQVVVPPPGRYALIENGRYSFEILDVSDPANPRLVLTERGPGLFYGKCITTELVDDRYASVYWHMGGPVWYDLAATPPVRSSEIKPVIGNIINGMAVHENRLVVLLNNGYTVTTPTEATPLKELPLRKLAGHEPLNGIPFIHRGVLFTCAGAWKSLRIVDIRELDNPRLIEKAHTPGNPDRVAACDDVILVPDGHAGLRMATLPQYFAPATTNTRP